MVDLAEELEVVLVEYSQQLPQQLAQQTVEEEVEVEAQMESLMVQPQPVAVELLSSTSFEIILLPPEPAIRILPLLKPHIESALEYAHREIDLESLQANVKRGSIQLWAVCNKLDRKAVGAATTMLVNYDLCKSVRIVTLSGKYFHLWKEPLLRRIEKFARKHNADRVEASGRKGWAKVLGKMGFEQAYVTFIKEL